MINHNLQYLLSPWISNINIIPNININSIKSDSRIINIGDLFIAICGNNTDGKYFIIEAIKRGAIAIIINTNNKKNNGKIKKLNGISIIYLFELLENLSALAGRFYNEPANKIKIIGVTGTNGKTTITQLIAQWVNLLGEISAVMGTIGNGIYGKKQSLTNNTTNSSIETQKFLNDFLIQNANLVAMEVSSHGLAQHRVSSIPFTAVVFSNLTEDHLDYHNNMEQYEQIKWTLFSKHFFKKAIINYDDFVGRNWLNNIVDAIPVSLNKNIDFKNKKNWMYSEQIYYNNKWNYVKFKSSWGNGVLKTKLIGEFNMSNLLLAFTTLLVLNYPLNILIKYSSYLNSVCGRMEVFTSKNKATMIVDYAHTPDAIEKVLLCIKKFCRGKLWCIFGCGGNRDKKKRPIMGTIVEKIADLVIITDDNPRKENSISIIKDIISGFKYPKKAHIIINRVEAINYAFYMAKNEDIILIAGKGHENYQIINNKYINYSDRLVVKKLLKKTFIK